MKVSLLTISMPLGSQRRSCRLARRRMLFEASHSPSRGGRSDAEIEIKGRTCSSARVACQAELRALRAQRCCLWRSWRQRAVSARTSPIDASLGSTRDLDVRVSARRMSGAGRDRVLRRGAGAGASESLGELHRMKALLPIYLNVERSPSGTRTMQFTYGFLKVEDFAGCCKDVATASLAAMAPATTSADPNLKSTTHYSTYPSSIMKSPTCTTNAMFRTW